MKICSLENILKQGESHKNMHTLPLEWSTVDFNRAFIPEKYTQLYHTDIYDQLNHQQKFRYNQLFALRTNEQFMLFESGFTRHVITNMLQLKMLDKNKSLVDSLYILLAEEEKHFHMFNSINQHTMPQLYANKPYYFLRLGWFERLTLFISCSYPQHLLSLLWLILLMEEHAVRFSKDVVSHTQTASSGELDGNFVMLHQLHLIDEAKHVHIDANLIDFVLQRSSTTKKNLNVKLLKKLLQATLRPKHAGVAVIRQLVLDCPELQPLAAQMVSKIREFTYDPCTLPMLEDRNNIPVTSALLDLHPEFEHALLF